MFKHVTVPEEREGGAKKRVCTARGKRGIIEMARTPRLARAFIPAIYPSLPTGTNDHDEDLCAPLFPPSSISTHGKQLCLHLSPLFYA